MINTSVFQDKKAAYFTLGCKLNFSETSTFGKMLADLGVHVAEEGEVADICLVNTCSVTEVADHKCRQAIHRLVTILVPSWLLQDAMHSWNRSQ